MTEPKPDADNRLYNDHLVVALGLFPYSNYGADDFPAEDPIDGGPSELVKDMATAVRVVTIGYLRDRAQSMREESERMGGNASTARAITAVLEAVADEMERVERPDIPVPHPAT